MKAYAKLKNAGRRAQWRIQGSIARARVGRHIRLAYIHGLPTTPPGSAGVEALVMLSAKALQALEINQVFYSSENLRQKGEWVPAGLGGLEVYTLDELAPLNGQEPVSNGAAFAIWVEEHIGAERLLALESQLDSSALIYLEIGGSGPDIVEMTDFLMKLGFEPVARDAQLGDETFHVLFLRARDLNRDCLAGLQDWVSEAVEPGVVRRTDRKQVPVLVPCFNNQTYCRSMITQLHALGIDDITLLDNASTSPAMHRFLDEAAEDVQVRRLEENFGPKRCLFAPGIFEDLPRYFCVTDPDIVFNPFLPADFLDQLVSVTKEFKVGKAGFALDLSHRQFFRDLSLQLLFQEWRIWEWEERFWSNPIGATRGNDKIFRADIDTTFALYDKQNWSPDNFTDAIRVAGRFTAQHAPWYKQTGVPQEEQESYRSEGQFSYYKM